MMAETAKLDWQDSRYMPYPRHNCIFETRNGSYHVGYRTDISWEWFSISTSKTYKTKPIRWAYISDIFGWSGH